MVMRRTLFSENVVRLTRYLASVGVLGFMSWTLAGQLAAEIAQLIPRDAGTTEPSRVEQRAMAEARSQKRMPAMARPPVIVTAFDAPLAPIGYLAATLDVAEASSVTLAVSETRERFAVLNPRPPTRCRAGCFDRHAAASLTNAVARPVARRTRVAAQRPKPVSVSFAMSRDLEPARDVLHRNLRAAEADLR